MTPYIFVTASVIAVISILFFFKISVERLKENPNERAKIQTQFMLWAFISEIIPIILIVYAFTNIKPVDHVEELYMPGIIILLLMGFAAFFIFLQQKVDVNDENKDLIKIFSVIALSLVNAIPIISIVALIMMLPGN